MASVTKNAAAPYTQSECRSRKFWTLHTRSRVISVEPPLFSPMPPHTGLRATRTAALQQLRSARRQSPSSPGPIATRLPTCGPRRRHTATITLHHNHEVFPT